jgi:hypothetical protein
VLVCAGRGEVVMSPCAGSGHWAMTRGRVDSGSGLADCAFGIVAICCCNGVTVAVLVLAGG